jgi:hypothetical protein
MYNSLNDWILVKSKIENKNVYISIEFQIET